MKNINIPASELAVLQEKVRVYESMLHSIQLFSSVVMDSPPIEHMFDIINSWSYAHRVGNGEFSDEEQAALVYKQFLRLKNHEWSESGRTSGVTTRYNKTNVKTTTNTP
jgi:hypothetical protein